MLFRMEQTTSAGIALVVAARMAEAKVSQRDAALATGIPLTTLHRRLTGQTSFTVSELDLLASLLGTTLPVLAAEAAA